MRSRCELICPGCVRVCLSWWSRNNKRHTRCIITLSPLSHFKGYPVHYTKWSDNGMQKEPAWPAESLQLEIEHAINYMSCIISYVRALFTFHTYCILQRFNYDSFKKYTFMRLLVMNLFVYRRNFIWIKLIVNRLVMMSKCERALIIAIK